jgi:hypothetical protein
VPVVLSTVGVVNGAERTIPELKEVSQKIVHNVPPAPTCRALGLSQSWFYKWRDRPPTPRQQRRAELAEPIRELFAASGGTYGSPRIILDLGARAGGLASTRWPT